MPRSIAVASLVLFATSAIAQQTTNCSPDGAGGVRCITNGAPTRSGIDWNLARPQPAINPMDAFSRGYEDAQRRRAQRQEQELIAAQQQALASQQEAESQAAANDAEQRELGRHAGRLV